MKDIPVFLRGFILIGNIGGKTIHLMIHPRLVPPRGNYEIHPPLQDPVYGTVALMVPTGGPNAPLKLGAPAYVKMVSPTAGLGRVPSPSQSPQVFVISDKPIPGRNAVVISSGFADLMDALHACGGATIHVT